MPAVRKARARRRLGAAAAVLTAAAALAALSQRLYADGMSGPGLAAALLALTLCVWVLFLSAPRVMPRRLRVLRLPWGTRVTGQGAAFVGLTLLVAGAALYSGNNLVYLVLSAMLAAMVVSGLVSRLGLAGLQLRVALPDHLFARREDTAQITIRNLKRWLPSFSIFIGGGLGPEREPLFDEVYCAALEPAKEARAIAGVRFPRRGRHSAVGLWLHSGFPFHFVERQTRLALGSDVLVYPSVEPSEDSERIVRELASRRPGREIGDSHDLRRLRPAQRDDSARLLDWKASARTGDLWVREYSRQDHRRVSTAFDTRPLSGSSDADFEKAIDTCAAVVWSLHGLGAEIDFRLNDNKVHCPPASSGIYEVLTLLAVAEPDLQAAPPEEADLVFRAGGQVTSDTAASV